MTGLVCLLFLFLVTQSYSLCVMQDGTNSTCTNSSLILVSKSQVKSSGFTITIKELPFISTNCSTTNTEKKVSAKMENLIIEINFTDSDKTRVRVNIPGDVTTGLHTILLSFYLYDPKCCNLSATMNHEITMKVIDDPKLWLSTNNPHTFHCNLNSQLSTLNALIEFKLNGNTLGYCGRFINPVEQKSDFLIRYDPSVGACTLEINKLNDKNKGSYSCSVMIPYPDDVGFLKLDSNSTALSTSQKNDHIYQIVLGVIAAIVVLIIVCLIAYKSIKKISKRHGKDGKEYQKMNNEEAEQAHPEPNQGGQNEQDQAAENRQNQGGRNEQDQAAENRQNQGGRNEQDQAAENRQNQGGRNEQDQAAENRQNQGGQNEQDQAAENRQNQGGRNEQDQAAENRQNQVAEEEADGLG